MNHDDFEAKFRELESAIGALPDSQQPALLKLARETRQRHRAIADSLQEARNAIDDWRLLAKYQLFDAEATLRESMARRDQPGESLE